MPTVYVSLGFRFVIHQIANVHVRGSRVEHLPPHVHLLKAGEEVVINIDPLEIRKIKNMGPVNVRQALRLVESHHTLLMTAWREFNG